LHAPAIKAIPAQQGPPAQQVQLEQRGPPEPPVLPALLAPLVLRAQQALPAQLVLLGLLAQQALPAQLVLLGLLGLLALLERRVQRELQVLLGLPEQLALLERRVQRELQVLLGLPEQLAQLVLRVQQGQQERQAQASLLAGQLVSILQRTPRQTTTPSGRDHTPHQMELQRRAMTLPSPTLDAG